MCMANAMLSWSTYDPLTQTCAPRAPRLCECGASEKRPARFGSDEHVCAMTNGRCVRALPLRTLQAPALACIEACLTHRYPAVRAQTSEQLYMGLNDYLGIEGHAAVAAQLLETAWYVT